MLPNPKKRKTKSKRASSPIHTQKNLVEWGKKADVSNLERGLLSLPVELLTEILDCFPVIGPYTSVPYLVNLLPEIYLMRIDILRALSQVCIDYRHVFLPLLWESLNVCFMRKGSWAFYKHVGDALVRRCDGLLANPSIASYIGTIRIILTRYQSTTIPKKFALLLSSLQNLHTLQIFHAHTRMTTAIKNGFEGVVLPGIRTLIIPGHCHEILKCCPQVTKVWCNWGSGSKLVTVIANHCKEVQEMRGFSLEDEKLVRRIIKAAPKLCVLEILGDRFESIANALSSFKEINTIIIRAYGFHLDRCIETIKQKVKDLAPCRERRYIRVWHGEYYSEVPF